MKGAHIMKAHNLTSRGSSSDPEVHLATVFPASTESVLNLLAAPQTKEGENDGRSEWVWIRFANGDLVMGIFPQGGVYEMLEGDVEEDYKAAFPQIKADGP